MKKTNKIEELELEIQLAQERLDSLKKEKEKIKLDRECRIDSILGRKFDIDGDVDGLYDSDDHWTIDYEDNIYRVSLDSDVHNIETIREFYESGLFFNFIDEAKNFSEWLRADKKLRDTIKIHNYEQNNNEYWVYDSTNKKVVFGVDSENQVRSIVQTVIIDQTITSGLGLQPDEYYMKNFDVAEKVLEELGHELISFAIRRTR